MRTNPPVDATDLRNSALARDQPFAVVVVGNAGVDTNVFLPGREIDFAREANFTDNRDVVGQAGGFAARGYARLGRRTAFIGHVGADATGRMVRDAFAADEIDASALGFDPAGTARSVNLMYRDGRRKNFYDGKSHMTLAIDPDACRRVLAGARLAHLNIPNWARAVVPIARELGVTVACDLQDVTDPWDPYRRDFVEGADILFFSAANHGSPAPIFAAYLAARPELVLVAGMGAAGAAVATREGVARYPPPALDLPVVDTNGAGDSLAVGFLSSFVLDGMPLARAILRGQIAARWCCALRADTSRLITREDLDRLEREIDRA